MDHREERLLDMLKRTPMGWCSRREGDDYGPNEHDGSLLHAPTDDCAHWRRCV